MEPQQTTSHQEEQHQDANHEAQQDNTPQEQSSAPPQVDPIAEVKAWWDANDFNGKQYVQLNDQAQLVLSANGNQQERVLEQLTAANASTLIQALVDHFDKVKTSVADFAQEWQQQEDKSKLFGKFSRLKTYLDKAKAIGDFGSLYKELSVWQQQLDAIAQEIRKVKEDLVHQAESLKDSTEWKDATAKFKELTEAWKNSGILDREDGEKLHKRFDDAKNAFFDAKRKATEDFEIVMLQNLDLKLEIVEIAEKHKESTDWKKTTELYKELMERWKAIGPTKSDKNEEYWQRFIAAKNHFFDNKKVHHESIHAEQEANLSKKMVLLEKAEALKDSDKWGTTSEAYAQIMEEWKSIGKVPLEHAQVIWDRLIAAKEQFFNRKKHFFESRKVSLHDNLAQKLALLQRAESLQHSSQWREATDELNDLMTEWKTIGAVPREQSDAIWERFLAARKHFFNRKDEDRERRKLRMDQIKESKNKSEMERVFRLEDHLREEKDKLADFQSGLGNIEPNAPKGEELRTHLNNLIGETEQKIQKLTADIEKLKAQNLPTNNEENTDQTNA